MKLRAELLISLGLLAGCANPGHHALGEGPAVQIHWQRLVNKQDQTCARCDDTGQAITEAYRKLKRSLKPLGIRVVLEKTALSPAEFAANPLESNRILISGKPLEEWLSATSGQSQCSAACGGAACRTLTVGGRTYEAIPSELVVRAGLLAAAQLPCGASREPCCAGGEQ